MLSSGLGYVSVVRADLNFAMFIFEPFAVLCGCFCCGLENLIAVIVVELSCHSDSGNEELDVWRRWRAIGRVLQYLLSCAYVAPY